MPLQSDASLGCAPESTYGTSVTPSKFFEFLEEGFDWEPGFTQGKGLRSGSRVVRAARRATGKQMASGSIKVEATSKGLGTLLSAAMGAVTSTQRATTGVYQHNFTLAQNDFLTSYTWQKGIPLIGGALQAHTFRGGVCSSLDIDCPNLDIVTLETGWNFRDVDTATAYAAPSYPTPMELFEFVEGAITIGGTLTLPTTTALASGGTAVATIRDFGLSIDNKLDDGGFNFGGGGKRVRKPAMGGNDEDIVKGKLTAEYSDNTMRDAYLAQTDLALTLTFQGQSVIGTGTDHPGLQITVPNLRLLGELPKVAGGDPVAQSIDWIGLDNLTQSPLIISYVTTDVTP
jgi:hypothetical protein